MMLTEIAQYLQELGIATRGTDLFLARRPTTPDNCTTLYQYPGAPPEVVQENPAAWEKPSLQVMVRNTDYVAAANIAQAIWNALVKVINGTLGGVRYHSIRPMSSPALIGNDSNDRFLVGFNAAVEKDLS